MHSNDKWFCVYCSKQVSNLYPTPISDHYNQVPDNLRKSAFQCCVLNACSVVSKRFDLMSY